MSDTSALEQKWRDAAEKKRSEFEANARSKYPDLEDATIDRFVNREIQKHIETLRQEYDYDCFVAAELQRARDKKKEEEMAREAQNAEERLGLKRKFDDLLRQDKEASHQFTAADAACQQRTETAAGICLQFNTVCDKLKELGESDIPPAEQVIPHVTAALKKDAQKEEVLALTHAPTQPLLLPPPPVADSSAHDGDLACLEKIVCAAVPDLAEGLTRKDLRCEFVSWLRYLSKKLDPLKQLIKQYERYETKLTTFEQKEEAQRGKMLPKKAPARPHSLNLQRRQRYNRVPPEHL